LLIVRNSKKKRVMFTKLTAVYEAFSSKKTTIYYHAIAQYGLKIGQFDAF